MRACVLFESAPSVGATGLYRRGNRHTSTAEQIRATVREAYGAVASQKQRGGCCGGGFDAFLAARQVGATGQVIGVGMTTEMLAVAQENAAKAGLNLAPDKPAVFREAFRVLVPGGRLAISDMVAIGDLPAASRRRLTWSACRSPA